MSASIGRALGLVASPFVASSFARILIQGIAFAQVVVASRYLDLAEYGLFAVASAIAVIVCSLLYTGFYEGLLRTPNIDAEAPTVAALLLGLGALFAVGIVAAALLAGEGSLFGALLLPLALVPLLAAPTAWCEALGVRRGMVRANAVLTMVAELVGFLALIVALERGFGPMALVWGRLVATVASLVLKVFMAGGTSPLGFDIEQARRALVRARPLYASAVARLFSNYSGDFLLALFLSPTAVGAFRAGSRVANTGAEVIVRPIHAIAWSRFARLERAKGQHADKRLRDAWREDTAFLTAIAWPSLVGLALVAEPVTELVLGVEWTAAAPVIAVLACARAIASTDFLVDPALVCRGRSDLAMRLRVLGAVLAVALVALAAPWGAVAAAMGLAVAAAGTSFLALTMTKRVLALSWLELLATLRPAIGVTIAVAVTALAADRVATIVLSPNTALLAVVAIGGAIWLAAFGALLLQGRLVLPRV